MKRIGILGSGKGSNFASIMKAVKAGVLPIEVALVISDVQGAGILKIAQDHGIAHRYVPPGNFRTKLEPERELEYVKLLQEARVDLVVLAGYMRILKAPFLNAFANRVLNIH